MEISFKRCKKSDFENFYNLRCDNENILWTGHKTTPEKESLRKWYINELKRKDRVIFLAKSQSYPNEALGYLYLDIIGNKKDIIDIGYGVHSKFTNKGIGAKTIKFAIDYCSRKKAIPNKIIGWVAIENFNSVKCFEKNNFSETNKTKKMFFKGLNKEMILKKYVLKLTN